MRKAIIVGASSGIGRELAGIMSGNGWGVGLAARRTELLKEIAQDLKGDSWVKTLDLAEPEKAMADLEELIEEMGGVDLIVINSGVGFHNRKLKWVHEINTINVNVIGFCAMINVAYRYFEGRGSGHIVGISSIAALRGARLVPAYNASKAFMSNYMEGLRVRAVHAGLPISVTDVRPGFVDTPMTRGQKGMFWVAPVDKASRQIYRAMERRSKKVYVTRRWTLAAWLFACLPDWLYARF